MIYNHYLELFSMLPGNKDQVYEYLEKHVNSNTEIEEYISWIIANVDIFDQVFYAVELAEKYYRQTQNPKLLVMLCSLQETFLDGFNEELFIRLNNLAENVNDTELIGNVWLLIASYFKDDKSKKLTAVQKSLSAFVSPRAYCILGECEKLENNDAVSLKYLDEAVKSVTRIFSVIAYNSADVCSDYFTFQGFCNRYVNQRHKDPLAYIRVYLQKHINFI